MRGRVINCVQTLLNQLNQSTRFLSFEGCVLFILFGFIYYGLIPMGIFISYCFSITDSLFFLFLLGVTSCPLVVLICVGF